MTQVFHPRFGLFVQLACLGLLLIAVAGILVWRAAIARPNHINQPIAQPVPFSHEHHVGQVGIDCRYCHASVETAAFAGIPPISTCMTCHSQLFTDQKMLQPVVESWRSGVAQLHWTRVHNLPDFVFFNHGIHVAKGVGCATCHGRIDTMPLTSRRKPLTMKWCLDCHRAPEQYLRPRSRVFDMSWRAQNQAVLGKRLLKKYHIDTRRLTDCSICHR